METHRVEQAQGDVQGLLHVDPGRPGWCCRGLCGDEHCQGAHLWFRKGVADLHECRAQFIQQGFAHIGMRTGLSAEGTLARVYAPACPLTWVKSLVWHGMLLALLHAHLHKCRALADDEHDTCKGLRQPHGHAQQVGPQHALGPLLLIQSLCARGVEGLGA